jgi:hypothetical protein
MQTPGPLVAKCVHLAVAARRSTVAKGAAAPTRLRNNETPRRLRHEGGPLRRQSSLSYASMGDERLVLGAPEWFADADGALSIRAHQEANEGRRVLSIGRSPSPLTTDHSEPRFPPDVQPIGLAVLAERLRPNAPETVAFFASQRVDLKVLPETLKSSAAPFSRRPRSGGSHPRASAP